MLRSVARFIAPVAALFLLFTTTGCVSSKVIGGEAYRAAPFSPDSLRRHGVAVLPTVTDPDWDQYRRPFQRAFDEVMYTLSDTSAVTDRSTAGDVMSQIGVVDRYPAALRTYRETGVLPAQLMRSIADSLDARYLLAIRLGPPKVARSFVDDDPNDELLSSTYSMRARGLVWDARKESVVWDATGGASGRDGSYTVLTDGSLEQSKMAGDALARRLFQCPIEARISICR